VEEIINKLGGASQIFIGTDANGHTQGQKHEQDETREMPMIGMDRGGDGVQPTNWNGRRMIIAMERHGMIAINTHYHGAGGNTYFTRRDGKDKSTRVDYILMQNNHTSMIKGCMPDKRKGFELQTNGGYQLNDHIPIVINANFGAKLCSRKKKNWIDKNDMRKAMINKDDEKRLTVRIRMEEYLEEKNVDDKNFHLTNAGERWDGLSRELARVESEVYSRSDRGKRSDNSIELYKQLLQIRLDGSRRLDEISWVLRQGCDTLNVIKYIMDIMQARRIYKTEAQAREDEELRGMMTLEEDETDEDKEDEEENNEYMTKKDPQWRGGSISSNYEVEEQEQTLIQTKYGYLRKEGAVRAIFTMWPTAARKLRTEKQMDTERKNKHQENRKAEAAQLEEDEKHNNTAGMWDTMRKIGGTNRGPPKKETECTID
jgi:hypothetical protein